MLKLRLQRRGKKNYATYRVVVAEDRAPVKGRYIADLGHYNPHTDEFAVKQDVVAEWIGKGAQPTPTVHNLLIEHKVITGEKVTSWSPKTRPAPEATEGAEKETTEGDETAAEGTKDGEKEAPAAEETEAKPEEVEKTPADDATSDDSEVEKTE